MGEYDHAAAAYTDFVTDESRNADRAELSHAYKYLTQYHLKRDQLDEANHYAQKCLQFEETKNEAKAFLKTIAQKRVKIEENPMMVCLLCYDVKKKSLNCSFQANSFNEIVCISSGVILMLMFFIFTLDFRLKT